LPLRRWFLTLALVGRSAIDEILKCAGLASKLSSDLQQRQTNMSATPNMLQNARDFLVSNLSSTDYRLSDCQQTDMNDLPGNLPAYGAIALVGQGSPKPLSSGSNIAQNSSTDPQFTDQSSFGQPSATSSGRLWTSSGSATPPLSFKALRTAYKDLKEISRILDLKANGEAGTNTDAEISRLSTEFYKVCLQRGGDEPVIDTREKYVHSMFQVAVLTEVVSKCSLSRDCIDSNGAATISYPDGVRTTLTPIAKGSEPEILRRVLNGAQGLGEQEQNIAGIWAFSVGQVLPFDSSTTSACRPAEDSPGSESNFMWYRTTPFGLAAVFHSSTVAPLRIDAGNGQDDAETCLFER
jgi:hypothetical protein